MLQTMPPSRISGSEDRDRYGGAESGVLGAADRSLLTSPSRYIFRSYSLTWQFAAAS
jgi:hypothetical protein